MTKNLYSTDHIICCGINAIYFFIHRFESIFDDILLMEVIDIFFYISKYLSDLDIYNLGISCQSNRYLYLSCGFLGKHIEIARINKGVKNLLDGKKCDMNKSDIAKIIKLSITKVNNKNVENIWSYIDNRSKLLKYSLVVTYPGETDEIANNLANMLFYYKGSHINSVTNLLVESEYSEMFRYIYWRMRQNMRFHCRRSLLDVGILNRLTSLEIAHLYGIYLKELFIQYTEILEVNTYFIRLWIIDNMIVHLDGIGGIGRCEIIDLIPSESFIKYGLSDKSSKERSKFVNDLMCQNISIVLV